MFNRAHKYSAKVFFIAIITIFISILSCSNPPKQHKTRVICHRGSGIGITIIDGDTFFENTLEAINYGFQNFDGVEIDIQMSLSGTIWVFHNCEINILDTSNYFCIPSSTDEQIKIANSKLPKYQQLCTLEEVLKLHQSQFMEDFISLDLKGYFDAECLSQRNVSKEYEISIANEIVRLTNKYKMQDFIMVETNYTNALDQIKSKNSNIECYFLAYNQFEKNLEKAIDKNYNGLSFNFRDTSLNSTTLQKAHNSNMKVQVWTIANKEDMQRAKVLKPDFIQSDILP